MGFFDQIPILSQVESLARVTFGDPEGALKCQENFLATCAVVSQVGSAVYAICGDNDKALQLQLQFADAMENIVASTPVVGYVGAGISELCNDRERAAKYLTSCNKSTAILAVGAATIATGGVAGTVLAAGAGLAAGIGMDEANNEIRRGMTGKRNDQGFITAVKNISQDRDDGKNIVEACFGASLGLVGDAAGGVGGRGLAKKVQMEYKKNSAVIKSVAAHQSSTRGAPGEHQSSTACDKKTVRKNLDDCISSARENKDFLADGKAAQGGGPVQCEMTGKAGVKGSGISESARKASTNEKHGGVVQDLKNARERLKEMNAENKAAAGKGQPKPHIDDALKDAQKRKTDLKAKTRKLEEIQKKDTEGYKELSSRQLGEHRNGLSCAEHQAAEGIYKAGDTPATSSSTRINTKGRVYGAERCGSSRTGPGGTRPHVPGCDQYQLGPVPTDFLHNHKLSPGLKKTTGLLALVYRPTNPIKAEGTTRVALEQEQATRRRRIEEDLNGTLEAVRLRARGQQEARRRSRIPHFFALLSFLRYAFKVLTFVVVLLMLLLGFILLCMFFLRGWLPSSSIYFLHRLKLK